MIIWLSLLIVAIVLILALLRPRLPTAMSDGPVCGNCNYTVRGTPTFICPECGSDLREVGILSPRLQTTTLGPLLRGALWTGCLVVTAAIVNAYAFRYVIPVVVSKTTTSTLISPRSGQYARVIIQTSWSQFTWPQSQLNAASVPGSVKVTLVPWRNGMPITLRVPDDRLGYEYVGAGGRMIRQSSGLNGAVIRNWLRTIPDPELDSIDTGDPYLRAESEEIARAIAHSLINSNGIIVQTNTPGSSFSVVVNGSAAGAAMWQPAYPIAFTVWFVIWLAGLLVVLRGWGLNMRNRIG
jgi:hypothetical protein